MFHADEWNPGSNHFSASNPIPTVDINEERISNSGGAPFTRSLKLGEELCK